MLAKFWVRLYAFKFIRILGLYRLLHAYWQQLALPLIYLSTTFDWIKKTSCNFVLGVSVICYFMVVLLKMVQVQKLYLIKIFFLDKYKAITRQKAPLNLYYIFFSESVNNNVFVYLLDTIELTDYRKR